MRRAGGLQLLLLRAGGLQLLLLRAGGLQLLLLLACTSWATSLQIPPEVEQLPTIITQTSSPIIALPYDGNVTIKCEATGNPQPQFRWTKDGVDFVPPQLVDRTKGSFVVHNKQLAQYQGKYKCYASNRLGTAMTDEIQLIALSAPKFPKEKLDPISVNEGDPLVLRCNPPASVVPSQIHWMSINLQHILQDERVSMGMDGNLYFSHTLQNDSRTDYTCVAAFNKIRTIVQKSPMTLVVKSGAAPALSKPRILLPSGVQSEVVLLKGKELKLECLPGGFPTPTVEWIKLGDNLPERTKYENFGRMLTVASVDESVEGKYMCKAQNLEGEEVHYFDVIVEEPPQWQSEPPQSQLSVIGSDVQIRCAVRGKPVPDITWRKNGEIFRGDPEQKKRVIEDTVVLHNAGPEDTAVYQCEASNTHGTLLANVNILVMNMSPLILTADLQEYAVVQGGNVVLNCNVFGSPPPSISWAVNETSANIEGERFSVLTNKSLRLISAEKNDSGGYVCAASNSEGKASITALLDVKDPTKIVTPPQDTQVVSGTAARLKCGAEFDESLESSFEVTWMKDDERIPLNFEEKYSMTKGTLQIMNVNLSDQGVYTCIAKTSLDMDNASSLITVLDVPDAPVNLSISELQDLRNISLSWTPGAENNSPVTEFVVEYEESQWEPGRWKELKKVPGNLATANLILHGHLNYQFRVYAANMVGPGPPSEPTLRHKTPPAAPDQNPENIKIQGYLPHQMEISWDPLLPIEHNGPGLEYRVSYRRLGVDDQWKESLVKRHSFVVRNTSTFVPYEIKIQSRNSHGWGPEPKTITGYSGEDVPTAAPRDVAVEVINTTVLRVSWTPVPPATVRGHLGGYNIHWLRKRSLLYPSKLLDERQSLSFPGKRNHAIVPSLEPFSEYSLTVNVFNKKGNGPKSDPVIFSTPEGVPDQVPILTTSNAQKDSILLVWSPPSETKGVLTGYVLQYHLINESSLEVLESREKNITAPDTTQWRLQDLQEGSLYRFQIRACTRAGCGPPRTEESHTFTPKGVVSSQRDTTTQGWLIGTMCAVALLTLVALIACFVRRNKGGKYSVKEKEDLHPDAESQGMNDDTYCEYSDSEEKPLKGSLCSLTANDEMGDSLSRDSLVDYADGGGEFDEDGSFIGEYSGPKHRGSVSEPNGHSVLAQV
ncbi:neural cell adhesion molecule L1-like protein isoform X2 [Periophthalmus magnuspinnatus]|uniref:neural cell adhesion molecule L1-like protein isoform X2 n=1 Tax=Periophthalmus magnuspinnatus TaxID=409849 RepID=UPI0024367DC8|nr:neural cell adhesion molecule L1-like protein isoform X2 [Periophthalmus magnuspinnatus]XP_055079142.1 neural cell adhesion molecule L1-like protein isoform X2 [Periophthalmus magnuspinnatus]